MDVAFMKFFKFKEKLYYMGTHVNICTTFKVREGVLKFSYVKNDDGAKNLEH